MTEVCIPPGRLSKVTNGWSVRWFPNRETTKIALLVEITDDGVLELDHIRTIRTSCQLSGATTDTDADPCEIPDAFRSVLREKGYKPAHTSRCGVKA